MRVEWHPLARADLAELVVYIATDDVSAAYSVHDKSGNKPKDWQCTRKSVALVGCEAPANW